MRTPHRSLSPFDLQLRLGDRRSLGDEVVAKTKLLGFHAGQFADRQTHGDDFLCLVRLEELKHAFHKRRGDGKLMHESLLTRLATRRQLRRSRRRSCNWPG